jgi:hypothetical protein
MVDDAGFREVFRADLPTVELAAALLEEHGIVTHRRWEDAGGLIIGSAETALPGRVALLMVPSIAYQEARQFLARFEEPANDYLTELTSEVQANRRTRKGVAAIILIILFAPLALAILSYVVLLVSGLLR